MLEGQMVEGPIVGRKMMEERIMGKQLEEEEMVEGPILEIQ
jgi:hypothetical protein